MKISVIIPTYKPQSYLWECLDSICCQTFPHTDFEVVLVLNGCNEPFNSQIKEYKKQHQSIQWNYIQTSQDGVSNARNLALDNARGNFVTFVDDDDYVSPSFLQELYDAADEHTVSLAYPYAFDDGCQRTQKHYHLTDTYDYCVTHGQNCLTSTARKFFSGPCMKLIPMSFIQNRRFDVRFKNGEDSIFMFLISDKISNVAFTSSDAIYYRRFRQNSAVTKKRGTYERVVNNWKSIKEYTRIFLDGKHSLFFYLTRIAAETRGIILAPLNSRK